MPVSQGSFTIGTGGTYTTMSAAFTDIVSPLTGNLTFTILTTQSGNNTRLGGINLGGFKLRFTGSVPMTAGNPNIGTIINRSSGNVDGFFFEDLNNGTLEIDNLRLQGPPTNVDRTRGPFHIRANAGFNYNCDIHDCIGNGLVRNGRCIRFTGGGSLTCRVWNLMTFNFKTGAGNSDDGDSIFYGVSNGTLLIENCSSHNDDNGYDCANTSRVTIRNCVLFGNGTKTRIRNGTNVNCFNVWTSDNTITTTNNTDCQSSIDPSSQFITTNTAANNYLALVDNIFTPSLAMAGMSPSIAFTSIRNIARPGPKGYISIGAVQLEPTAAPPKYPPSLEPSILQGSGIGIGILKRI